MPPVAESVTRHENFSQKPSSPAACRDALQLEVSLESKSQLAVVETLVVFCVSAHEEDESTVDASFVCVVVVPHAARNRSAFRVIQQTRIRYVRFARAIILATSAAPETRGTSG